MEFHDRPLLSYADLSIILLKTARRGNASLDDALRTLHGALAAAGQRDLPAEADLYRHLNHVCQDLRMAGLVEPAGADGFHITERGEQALAAHPSGVDQSVLADFAEFRAGFQTRPAAPGSAEPPSYSEGYDAFRAGCAAEDNPYARDCADHLAWQNGWSEARDMQEPDRSNR